MCEESRWEGYGRDDGRDQGRDENQRILYIKGFRAIEGRDGGFSDKNYRLPDVRLRLSQRPLREC